MKHEHRSSSRQTDKGKAVDKYDLTFQGVIIRGIVRGDTREPTIVPFTYLSTIILHLH
jgi:hypothetical protein